jgi:hypothetical protein
MMERVVTAEIKLTAREYKLLLDPLRFKEAYGSRGVHVFWEKGLKPIIADCIDRRRSGKPRFKGEFGRPTERVIRFFDTDDMVLTRSEWSLRQRTRIVDDTEDHSEHELTLKLRTPDLFIAAATVVGAEDKNITDEFEEDIAPLAVAKFDTSGDERVILSSPASVRCRFARAFRRKIHASKPLGRLAEVYRLFHGFDANLTDSALGGIGRIARLLHGQVMLERVYNGAAVALGAGVDGRFTFTEWYLQRTPRVQRVAEISFKLAIQEGGLARSAARRALMLFTSLQDNLCDVVDLDSDSKTALALPDRTRLIHHVERDSHARPEASARLCQ